MRVQGGDGFSLAELLGKQETFLHGGLWLRLSSSGCGLPFWPPDSIVNEVSFVLFHRCKKIFLF